MAKKCYVEATARGKKEQRITKDSTKKQAEKVARNLRREMKIAIPKYRWASKVKVKC